MILYPYYNPYRINHVNVREQKRKAANAVCTNNPPFTVKDFLSFFPNFETQINHRIIENYIVVAQNNVNIGRWGKNWEYGMCLFIAHLCAIHAMMAGLDEENPNQIDRAGITGMVSSKRVGDVSISYDSGSVTEDLEGWGNFKLTTYGSQFATMAQTLTIPLSVIS